jgi:hypothetical protein
MPALVPPSIDERTLLIGFLDQQRYAVKLAAYGLTDAQAREARTPSRLTVGGLIKHLTRMERGWLADVRREAPAKSKEDYLDAFEMQPGETVEGLIADYDAVARDTAGRSRRSTTSTSRCRCRRTCRGSRRALQPGRSAGCCCT